MTNKKAANQIDNSKLFYHPNEKIRLLLVDDEDAVLRSLERTFREKCYEIITKNSAVNALEVLKENCIDVVISDMRMPEMKGADFLSIVKKNHPDVMRIVLSAYSDAQDIMQVVNEADIYAYITKPWDDLDLKLKVRNAAEERYLKLYFQDSLTKKYEELQNISEFDTVTKVANRLRIDKFLKNQIELYNRFNNQFVLIMIEIDHYHEIKNQYGTEASNELLNRLCERIKSRLRNYDLLGRWDDDNFLIVSSHTSYAQAIILAESIREIISARPFPTVGNISISLGVSEYDNSELSINELINMVEEALLEAKESGDNQTIGLN